MRLSALLWLGLAALHQSVNANQVENPVPRSGDASGWQFKGPYQSPQRLSQWRRPQPSLSIRQQPVRPIRPLSRQAYVPRMVSDARVVEPYKPVMMDGVVVQPYRPQMNDAPVVEPYKPVLMGSVVVQPYRPEMAKDMLVQLLPTRGNRFVGLQAGQQGYAKPHEQGYNKISGASVVSTVNQMQNVEPNSYITPTVMQENVIAPSILPPAIEAPTMIPPCNDSTTPLPQVATQTASPSVDASVPAALPAATPSSEAIDMYDGFQIVEEPIIWDAARLVQPYQPTMEEEAAQPEILVPGNAMVHEYLPTLEDARIEQAFAQPSSGPSQPYRPNVEVEALRLRSYHRNLNRDTLPSYRPALVHNRFAEVPADIVLSPYRPTLQEPVDVDVPATMASPPYRPKLEEPSDASTAMVPQPYRPTLEDPVDVDSSTTIDPGSYRRTLQEPVDVDVSEPMAPLPYRPKLEEPSDASAAMVPQPYRPTLEDPVDVDSSTTIDPGSYRRTLQEPVDVDVSEPMAPLPYRPTLEDPVGFDASATMDPPPYRPAVQEPVDADASKTMVPPQYRSTLEKAVHQPYMPSIEKSASDAGTSTTIYPIRKTDTLDESTLSSESSTHSTDVPQKDLLLNGSMTLKIQSTTTAGSYSMGIESTTPINDSSKDAIVLENEDFVASKTKQNPVYTATPEIFSTTTTEAPVKGFCAGLEVGIHRHPEKCDGIIRCDGVHTILMPSCPSGLLFNNLTKACDYPTSVPECGSSIANDSASANCDGHEHGAHIQDPENCGVFWRCVWDEMVKMECPKGTFFNEMTSVCDWPEAVPTCEANGARKTAESEVTTDEE